MKIVHYHLRQELNRLGRRPNPERRGELLGAIVEYVLANGVADLSLRPLARDLGVSTFALVYHFGSREGVIVAALTEAERREREAVRVAFGEVVERSPGALLRRFWSWWLSSEANLAHTRLYFEVYGMALRDPAQFADFPGVHPWLDFVRDAGGTAGIHGPDAEVLASVVVGTVMGLQLDVLNTGDRARTTAAIEAMAAMLDGWNRPGGTSGGRGGRPSVRSQEPSTRSR